MSLENKLNWPYRIGVTGGIGSGKSVVSQLLRLMGVPVYDCDSEAKRLMCENPIIREALVDMVGADVYDAEGKLNRSLLASYMFGDAERVAAVNRIVHPAVRAEFERWTHHTKKTVVAVESAILFEAGMDADVNSVWLVYAPESVRVQRTVQRDETNEEAVRNRMRNQMDERTYIMRADRMVYNDERHSLIAQIQKLLRGISCR